jgi:hypothetical protein
MSKATLQTPLLLFFSKGEKRGDNSSGAGFGSFPTPRALCSSAVEEWPDPALGSV